VLAMTVSWPANRTGSPDAVVLRPSAGLCGSCARAQCQQGSRRPTRKTEPHHRSHLTLDRSMVLFDNIVEVLDLPDLNLCVVRRVVALVRCGVGATLVDGNLRRCAMLVTATPSIPVRAHRPAREKVMTAAPRERRSPSVLPGPPNPSPPAPCPPPAHRRKPVAPRPARAPCRRGR
jgi:hypothetical protein